MSIFLPALKQNGHLNAMHMTVCVVGSRKLGSRDDYGSQGWDIFAPQLSIYGFDADADACEVANQNLQLRQITWNERHIPIALSKSPGEQRLFVTHHPMCSSLYPPNELFLQRFDGLLELMELDFTIDLETTTLDLFCQTEGVTEVDFLQIDVQGADLQVLEGSAALLEQSVWAIQIEVEPSPLYCDQPLFADVDTYLRRREFTLFDLKLARRVRSRSPIQSPSHPGQILWGDAYYFYDLLRQDMALSRTTTPAHLLKLACIADVMQFSDYALEVLEYLTLNFGNTPEYNVADAIFASLSQYPELVQHGLASLPVIQNIQDFLSPGML